MTWLTYKLGHGGQDDLAHLQTTASAMVVEMTWYTSIQTIASAMVVYKDTWHSRVHHLFDCIDWNSSFCICAQLV